MEQFHSAMEPNNNQLKSLLHLVDNFGFVRAANSETGDEISFHCFIGDCKFWTKNLGYMIDHAADHHEKWSGFCYACNIRIFDDQEPLLKELSHMDGHKFLEDGISIDVQQLSGVNLQAAVMNAKARSLSRDDCSDENLEILLRPWLKPILKTPNYCRKMLSKICLYALYKCMEMNCAFSTSCANNMLTHLQHHADNGSGASGWLQCAYCDLIGDSCLSLVQHIWNEHGSSLYQCPYCFYRSCTAYNVVFHLTQFHDTSEKSVLVCNGKEMSFTAEKAKAVIERLRSENVRPLRCSEVCCNKVTYLMDDYIVHLKNSNKLDENFNCQRCGSSISISEAIEHLLWHNIGVYQCIYCIHGENDIGSIQNHMVHSHPTRLPFVCVRLTRKNDNLTNEELATVESTMIAKLAPTVFPNLLTRCPYTDEQLQLAAVTITPNPCSPHTFGEVSQLGKHPINPTSLRQFASQDILSYNELRDEYTSDDWNQYFATHLSSSLADVSQHSVDSGIGAHLNVSDGETNDPNAVRAPGLEKRPNGQQREIDEAVSSSSNSLAKQIQAAVLQTNSESIPSDDELRPTNVNADTDNVNAIRRSEPAPVIPNENTNSILNKPDDGDDTKPSTSKPKTKPRARPQPEPRAIPQQPKPSTRTQTKLKETTEKVINATAQFQKMSDPKWYESVKYFCAHCPKADMNLGEIYEHWKSNYEKAAVPIPFRFRIVKVFKCYHCRQCNTYAVLNRHCEQKHAGKGFAIVDIANASKCGLCDSGGTDIIDHFKKHHNSNNAGIDFTVGLEDYLTDELLDKFKTLSVTEDPTADDRIMYGCSTCKVECSNEMDTVVHMRKHLIQYRCKFESCKQIFESLSLIKVHHKIIHGDDETYRNVDINENLDKYLDMKIIFPNGLLLTKRECQRTEFGAMDAVTETIQQINDSDLRELRKRPAEKRQIEPIE